MAAIPPVERREDTLVVRFPAADYFECTEDGCNATFKASSWTATRRSLERHLERDHDIRIRTVENICGKCNSALGLRPTVHACLVRTPDGLRPAAPKVFAFRCDNCEQTFPTKRGLYNHTQWHKEQEKRAQNAVDLPRPQTGRNRRGPTTGTAATTTATGTASRAAVAKRSGEGRR
jgi:hypothetical protein